MPTEHPEAVGWLTKGFLYTASLLGVTWAGIVQYFHHDARKRIKKLEDERVKALEKGQAELRDCVRQIKDGVNRLNKWGEEYMKEEMEAHDAIANALHSLTTHVRTLRVKSGEDIKDVLRDENGASGRIDRRKTPRDL